ncbi:MAG: anthranilate phosphoribosyltransferase [Candidatus Nanopelagicales bacterium]
MSTPASPPSASVPEPDDRTWPDLIAALLRREDLGADATSWAMARVMEGDATPVQLAGFLVALRAKGETAGEVAGLVSAMLDHAATVDLDPSVGPTVDTCGTGGDRSHTVNISTMAAVVVAAAGAPVVKHGNRAASSAAGSADVLEALGVAVDLAPGLVGECLSDAGIVFCFAPVFHPGMRHAAVARRELGVGTVFNVLGPLANPARPAAQVVGCADPRLAPVMAQALLDRGTRALVVRGGTDGLDELSTAAPTTVWDATGSAVVESQVDALDLGIARAQPDALRGQDAAYNAAVARAVLSGERSASLDPVRDSVLLGAAAALVAYDAVPAGPSGTASVGDRLAAALPRAAAAIDDGSAGALLDRWVAVSQRLASR